MTKIDIAFKKVDEAMGHIPASRKKEILNKKLKALEVTVHIELEKNSLFSEDVKQLKIWSWMSASLSDENVCSEMKQDIHDAFAIITPVLKERSTNV